MGCSHFYEGLWSASPHFYEGLFDVLAHFYEGLLWSLLHFYEGLWAWESPPSTPIAPGQRRLSSVLGLLSLASAWGWLSSFFWQWLLHRDVNLQHRDDRLLHRDDWLLSHGD